MPVTRHGLCNLVKKARFLKIFVLNIFVGTLDPQKLIKLKINHMNIFHMKISQITVQQIYGILYGVPKCGLISHGFNGYLCQQIDTWHRFHSFYRPTIYPTILQCRLFTMTIFCALRNSQSISFLM